MPKLPFKSSEYYDQNDDDSDELNVDDMEKIISFVGGETDENPFSDRATTTAVGGYGRSNSTESSPRGQMANRTNFPNGRVIKMTKKELRDMSIEEAEELIDPVDVEEEDNDEIGEVSTTGGIAGFQAPLGSEIWGGKLQHKHLDGWKEADEDDVEEPNMKKSYKTSVLHKNQKRNKRENKQMSDDKKAIKLTEEQLEQMIKEGFFSQLFTKAAGTMSGAHQGLANKLADFVTGGDEDIKKKQIDPKVRKQVVMAERTITAFKESFKKLMMNNTKDIIGVFGSDPDSMVPDIKEALGLVDASSTKFIEALDTLIQIIQQTKK